MRWMLANGTRVRAGVTPGKGGTQVDDLPVFHSVQEARSAFPDVTVSAVVVPSAHVFAAVQEALETGLSFIYILTEHVPVHDVLKLREMAHARDAVILGPASVGLIRFPAFQLGYLGGEHVFTSGLKEGDTAVLSTSGGMTNEIMMACARAGIGLRIAIALGGGMVCGTTLIEALQDCEEHHDIRRMAIFTEPGQPLLDALLDHKITLRKPTAIFLAGGALDDLPKGVPYGHTGTIIGEGQRSVAEMKAGLRALHIPCAETMQELISHLSCL